uniref:NTR domain-containing protein n=1 Tax=Panagrellus redivivus TaxID=6233 RepID=A0A7E4UT26_PANRE
MTKRAVCVLICCIFVTVTLACKCQFQPAQVSFCKAHWVAHTKIDLRQTKQANPTRKGLNNIRYKVTYGDVFKKPDNISSLPTDIYTPSEPPACGLLLEAGKEYLLAGRIVNGTATTVLCGQILQDDPEAQTYEKVLEWGEVAASLKNRLKIHAFDKC